MLWCLFILCALFGFVVQIEASASSALSSCISYEYVNQLDLLRACWEIL
jgi:hypothetical protein